jgi:hypothetical protein
MLEHYRPQLAVYLLGTNDLLAGRPSGKPRTLSGPPS